jgi:hypothetical protein
VPDFPEFQERTQTEETQGEKQQSVSSFDSVLRTPLIYHTRLWELGHKQLWNKEEALLNSACSHVWSTANFPPSHTCSCFEKYLSLHLEGLVACCSAS